MICDSPGYHPGYSYSSESKPMLLFRIIANMVVLSGIILLVRVLYGFFTGQLAVQTLAQSHEVWTSAVYALALRLPVPFHVMSVGLFLQRKWLSPTWAKIAWYAVVISGCWLGIALVIRLWVM
jgi:uncharacterized membrane protein YGL010W